MEENIVYIPYGQEEINQQEFLEAAANDVQNYVNSRAWSKKRKQAFIDAYSDLMSKGITGASIDNSGFWSINHSGSIDLDSMPKMNREMYGAAAQYIKSKMEGASRKSKKVEEENVNLPKFDNTTLFHNYLGNNYYGGRDIDIANGWNTLDERDSTGKLSTTERTKRMIEVLQKYKQSLQDQKFDFKDTPFKDITDVNNRIDNAISALQSGDSKKAADALNKIGIQYNQWFSNGLGDASGYTDTNGNSLTYGQLAELNKQEAERKLAEQQATQAAQKQQQYQNKIFIVAGTSNKMTGKSPIELKEKYGDQNQLLAALGGYAQRGLKDLTPEEQSEVHGIYKNLAKENIDSNTLKVLQSMSSGRYKGAAPNRFKKISGIDNLVYDSIANQVIQLGNRDQLTNQQSSIGADLFEGIKTSKEQQEEYLNSKIPGMTNAEWQELMAIGADIASIINPEPFSAAGLGAIGAGLRHAAKNNTPGHEWGFWEGVGQGIDYLTGIIGAVPLAGDLVLGGKTLITGSKVMPKLTKALRLVGRTGAWKDIYDSLDNGGKQTASKILNGEELTVQDWRNVGQLIRGIAGHKALNTGNRALRKTAEKSGFETEATSSNVNKLGWVGKELRREGFFSSKIKGENQIPTLKVKKVSEDGKVIDEKQIDLTPTERDILGKTKPSELNAKAKELLKEKLPEGYEVNINTGWRAKAKNLTPYRSKNKDSFGVRQEASTRGEDVFDEWLKKERGIFSKIHYGWNPRLRAIREGLNISSAQPKLTPSTTSTEKNGSKKPILALPNKNQPLPNSPLLNNKNIESPLNIRRDIELPARKYTGNLNDRIQITDFQQSYGLGGLKSTSMKKGFGENAVKAGKFENELLNIALSRNQAKELRVNPGKLQQFRYQNAKKVQDLISSKKATDKEIAEVIKGLKKKGYLKQGGNIVTKDNIAEILKDVEL